MILLQLFSILKFFHWIFNFFFFYNLLQFSKPFSNAICHLFYGVVAILLSDFLVQFKKIFLLGLLKIFSQFLIYFNPFFKRDTNFLQYLVHIFFFYVFWLYFVVFGLFFVKLTIEFSFSRLKIWPSLNLRTNFTNKMWTLRNFQSTSFFRTFIKLW